MVDVALGDEPDLRELRFDQRSPCADCPFRLDVPCHEGVAGDLQLTMGAILAGDFRHTCHKTDPRADSDEGKKNVAGPVQHCAGAMIMMLKSNKISATMTAAERAGRMKIKRLNLKAPVGTMLQLLKRYMLWLKKKYPNATKECGL